MAARSQSLESLRPFVFLCCLQVCGWVRGLPGMSQTWAVQRAPHGESWRSGPGLGRSPVMMHPGGGSCVPTLVQSPESQSATDAAGARDTVRGVCPGNGMRPQELELTWTVCSRLCCHCKPGREELSCQEATFHTCPGWHGTHNCRLLGMQARSWSAAQNAGRGWGPPEGCHLGLWRQAYTVGRNPEA